MHKTVEGLPMIALRFERAMLMNLLSCAPWQTLFPSLC